MASRCVLVSYNGRNKLLKIPTLCDQTDIQYLDNECRKLFSFSSNVHINLTFQKYDPAWEMDIDLDSDYNASDKDKLKLVVTPLLVDNVSTPAQSVSQIVSQTFCQFCLNIIKIVCLCQNEFD